MATRYNIKFQAHSTLKEQIKEANLIISATNNTNNEYIINKQDFINTSPYSTLLIDLSVPRTIEPETENIKGLFLYNIDQIQSIYDKKEKISDFTQNICKNHIEASSDALWVKMQSASNSHYIKQFRQNNDKIRDSIKQKALIAISQGQCVEKSTRKIVYTRSLRSCYTSQLNN